METIKKVLLCLITVLLLSSSSCKDFPFVDRIFRLSIINNSPDPIYSYTADELSVFHYPDTVLPEKKLKLFVIKPEGTKYNDSRVKWEQIMKELPADTLSIYFMDPDVYENTDWAEIRKDYKILIRYDLSIEDLNKLEFNVPYPPTEAMKDMKMYPAYKTTISK